MGIGTAPAYVFEVEGATSNNWLAHIANTHATNGYGLKVKAGDDNAVDSFRVSNTSNSTLFSVGGGGNVIVNDSALASADFRVESNGNENMLFVDGGNNCVNIGSPTDETGSLNVAGSKGTGSGIPTGQLTVVDETSIAAGVGGAIQFKGQFTSGGITAAGSVEAYKANATDGNYGFGLLLRSRTHGGTNDSRLYMDETITVFNDGGNNTDFRVESSGNANMFYVDGGDDRVCIGTNSSGLTLASALGSSSLTVADGILFGTSSGTTSYVGTGNTTGDIAIVANAAPGNLGASRSVRISTGTSGGGGPNEIATFNADVGSVFNVGGATAQDFRVASNGNNNAFFVDGGNNRVMINTNNDSTTSNVGVKWHLHSNQTVQYIVTNAATGTYYPFGIYNANGTFNGSRFKLQINGGLANFSANNVNLSDQRMKENITLLADGALAKICAIPVKTFNYKDEPDGTDVNIGVIAQDVEAVAPELVDHEWGRDNDGVMADPFGDGVPLKSVFSDDIQYTMMKAIQELKTALDVATARITALEA